MDAFEEIADIKNFPEGTTPSGNELTFDLQGVLQAIDLAAEHSVAVLGIEQFDRRPDGFYVMNYSGYEFEMNQWPTFVLQNSAAAKEFVHRCATGESLVFVITATSMEEFVALSPK